MFIETRAAGAEGAAGVRGGGELGYCWLPSKNMRERASICCRCLPLSYGRNMISVEELVEGLRGLTPEQLQQVARVVHELSRRGEEQRESQTQENMPQMVVEKAVLHGWPRELFTELIGSLPEMERGSQPAYNTREHL